MPNKNYESGRALEYRVCNYWKDLGYEVFRSAGSHKAADVIVFHKYKKPRKVPGVLMVQCKTKKKGMTKQQVKDFREYCKTLGTFTAIAYKDSKGHLVQDFIK
jgi:Holliday junction resolvase